MILFKHSRKDFFEFYYSVECLWNGIIVNRVFEVSLTWILLGSGMETEKCNNRSVLPKSKWTIKKNRELLLAVNRDKQSWEEVSRLLEMGVKVSHGSVVGCIGV